MKENKHWALFGSGISMESNFIKKLLKGVAPAPFQNLNGKQGVLFSNYTLNQFIKEEAVHDDFTLSKKNHRSIRTFSSGEQKKALLTYLLSKKSDFIILDNVFDMLDTLSKDELISRLIAISEKMPIIQIFRRRDDILPFIDTIFRLHESHEPFSGTLIEYQNMFPIVESSIANAKIPGPVLQYDTIADPLIKFNNISVQYGETHILNAISWEINHGDFWQLLGPNGSGKTTLLTMLTGDNPKAYGQDLIIFGTKKGSGESIWDIKKKIGYVTPAMTVLFNGRHTVEGMVISGLYDSIGLYTKPTYEGRKLANKWIDLIGLEGKKHKYFSELPEEQQCMVLIARSMIKHPPLLILDEPTHGLDDQNALILTSLINKIAKESQTSIIYVSHKKENGLEPTKIYELIPTDKGSIGRIKE